MESLLSGSCALWFRGRLASGRPCRPSGRGWWGSCLLGVQETSPVFRDLSPGRLHSLQPGLHTPPGWSPRALPTAPNWPSAPLLRPFPAGLRLLHSGSEQEARVTHGGVQRCGLPQNCANVSKAARVPAVRRWRRRRPGVVTCALWGHRPAEVIWQRQRRSCSQPASPTGASPPAARVQPGLPGGPLRGGAGPQHRSPRGQVAPRPSLWCRPCPPRGPPGPRCSELMDTRVTRKYAARPGVRSRDSRRAGPRRAGGASRGRGQQGRGHASCL